MTTAPELSLEERTYRLLQHLGIQQAHFGGMIMADWRGFARAYPECILSLTLVSPQGFDPETLQPFGSRVQVVTGDQGPVPAHDPVRQRLDFQQGRSNNPPCWLALRIQCLPHWVM